MPSQFHLEYFDPPAELSEYVLALYHFVWDDRVIADRHPGALGQLALFPIGSGEMYVDGRTIPVEGDGHLFAGFEIPHQFRMEGPWHAMGASLSALGWAALTGVPANRYFNRFIQPSELLGPEVDEFIRELSDQYRSQEVSGKGVCDALAGWIAPRLGPVPESHRQLIGAAYSWLSTSLNPDVEELFEVLPYSRRQAERLVARYFGMAPRALARRYRAVRAAGLLSLPELTDEGEAEIASAFYDQPHMIREIRHYCGFTPTRLGGEEAPLFQTMVQLKNLDRLKEFRRIG
ncbi:hypothetical protein ACI5KX_01505 [Erythrobacter sp. GH1-10]|uniref:hypothetical protein n=1 Tax=Erythrobacter sp. GH1-10 TaxID=3349334 RepID=UPI003877CBD8